MGEELLDADDVGLELGQEGDELAFELDEAIGDGLVGVQTDDAGIDERGVFGPGDWQGAGAARGLDTAEAGEPQTGIDAERSQRLLPVMVAAMALAAGPASRWPIWAR